MNSVRKIIDWEFVKNCAVNLHWRKITKKKFIQKYGNLKVYLSLAVYVFVCNELQPNVGRCKFARFHSIFFCCFVRVSVEKADKTKIIIKERSNPKIKHFNTSICIDKKKIQKIRWNNLCVCWLNSWRKLKKKVRFLHRLLST